MQTYRYTLQPYKGMATRHTCPACNKPKTFTFYIDTETGEPLHPTVGRCNREDNCGYHYKPKQYFEANPGINNTQYILYHRLNLNPCRYHTSHRHCLMPA